MMKFVGKREVLHLYDVSEEDRELLESQGYIRIENDIFDNEMWERIDNFIRESED